MNLLGAALGGGGRPDDVNVLINENASIREELAHAKETIKTLSKKLSVANQDVARSVTSVAHYDKLEAELTTCKKERDIAHEKLNTATKKNEELTQKISELETKLDKTTESFTLKVETMDGEIAALQKKLDQVTTTAQETTAAKKSLELRLAEKEERVQSMEQEAIAAERQQNHLQKEVNILSSEKEELVQKTMALSSTLNDNKRQNLKLAAEKSTLHDQLDKAVTDIRKLQAKSNSLHESIVQKDKALQSLRITLQKVEAAKEQETSQLKLVRRDLAVVSNARDKALTHINSLNQTLDEVNMTLTDNEKRSIRSIEQLESIVRELEKQKSTLEVNLQTTTTKLEAANLEVLNLERTVEQQKDQIAEEKAKLAAVGDSENVQLLNVGKITSCTEKYF